MYDKCLILGSGFGLYGYLPAVYESGYEVYLPQTYKSKYSTRPELIKYFDRIQWFDDRISIFEIVKSMNLLVIAKRPIDQSKILITLLRDKSILFDLPELQTEITGTQIIRKKTRIVLEKPLAPSPEKSVVLWNAVSKAKGDISIRMGYSFLYTKWGKEISQRLLSKEAIYIKIDWRFEANHYANSIQTWKRYESQGGGTLRFYGIQVIGLLSIIEGWRIMNSEVIIGEEDESTDWACELGNEKAKVSIHICSNYLTDFFYCCIKDRRSMGLSTVYTQYSKSPFDKNKDNEQDVRVNILKEIIGSFDKNSDTDCVVPDERCIKSSLELWSNIEKKTIWKKRN